MAAGAPVRIPKAPPHWRWRGEEDEGEEEEEGGHHDGLELVADAISYHGAQTRHTVLAEEGGGGVGVVPT